MILVIDDRAATYELELLPWSRAGEGMPIELAISELAAAGWLEPLTPGATMRYVAGSSASRSVSATAGAAGLGAWNWGAIVGAAISIGGWAIGKLKKKPKGGEASGAGSGGAYPPPPYYPPPPPPPVVPAFDWSAWMPLLLVGGMIMLTLGGRR